MDRRDFLKLSSASATAIAVDLALPDTAFARRFDVRKQGFSILQGLTTQRSTQLTIDVPKKMTVHYELFHPRSGVIESPLYLKSEQRSYSNWRVDKIAYVELPYMGEFIFRVLDDKGKILDERNLKLLELNKSNARVAFMSCMMESNRNKDKIWPRVEQADCDMLFFLGDHVYGDRLAFFNSPELLWDSYIETRQNLHYYHWKNLKPVICTWDDHDYGRNNADGKYRYKENSLLTFRAFTAQDAIVDGFKNGPGVSSFFKAFGQKFILLDNRFYKNLSYDGINGFLGKEQLQWTFDKLSDGSEPNWIMEGSQFFQGQRKGNECYILDAPEECEIFKKQVSQLNSPSVFVAGDVHFTEISKVPKDWLGYNSIEITSSSLHSMGRNNLPKNPDRIQGAVKENFIIVDLIPTRFDLAFDIQSIGISKVNFKDSFGL